MSLDDRYPDADAVSFRNFVAAAAAARRFRATDCGGGRAVMRPPTPTASVAAAKSNFFDYGRRSVA